MQGNRLAYIFAALGALALVVFFVMRLTGGGPDQTEGVAPSEEEIEEVEAITLDYENTLILELSTGGPVVIKMFPDKAPMHVARFKELARQGFFDGIVFHRVIEGFMAQTGDPTGTGTGGSGQNITAEFNDIMHVRGVVSTARANDPNSADSQFFIMYGTAAGLDGKYTAWGTVVQGMEYVDALAKGPREQNGMVPEDQRDHIITMQVLADVGEEALYGDDSDEE